MLCYSIIFEWKGRTSGLISSFSCSSRRSHSCPMFSTAPSHSSGASQADGVEAGQEQGRKEAQRPCLGQHDWQGQQAPQMPGLGPFHGLQLRGHWSCNTGMHIHQSLLAHS